MHISPNDPLSSAGRCNSLNLSGKQLGELLDTLESRAQADEDSPASHNDGSPARKGTKRREFVRWPFRKESLLAFVRQPGGSEVTFRVPCRNLSRSGVGFLHSAFLYPGSQCRVSLPHPKRGTVTIAGTIARCQHISGTIHEIGVRFAHPIRVREFASTDPFYTAYSACDIDVKIMEGRVVVLSTNPLDEDSVRLAFKGSPVKLCFKPTLVEAIDAACEGCDLFLAAGDLPEFPPRSIRQSLSDAGLTAPLLLMLAPSAAAREMLNEVATEGALGKPLRPDEIRMAAYEWLVLERAMPKKSKTA